MDRVRALMIMCLMASAEFWRRSRDSTPLSGLAVIAHMITSTETAMVNCRTVNPALTGSGLFPFRFIVWLSRS
jgi:hypothetical protein